MRRALPSLHTAVVLLAALFAVAGSIAIGFGTPPLNSGDEAAHLDYAITVWHGHLPVFENGLTIRPPFGSVPPAQWVSQHPPLFYAILAPFVGPLWDGGHPYASVLAGRAVNAVLAGLTVLATGWGVRRVLPRRPELAGIAALVVSLTGMFLLVGGAVYNDLPNVGFGALAVGVAATAIRRGLSTRLVIAGALVNAGGMLSRLSFAVFLIAVVVAFALARGEGRWNRLPGKALAVVVALAAPGIAAGWFFLRNRALTGNIAGSHPEWAAEHLHRHSFGFVQTITTPSFWSGVFSVFRSHLQGDWAWSWSLLLVPLVLAVIVGIVPFLRRSGFGGSPIGERDRPLSDLLVAAMLVAVLALVVFLQVRFTMQGGAAQARYGLPVVPVLATAMAIGLGGFGRVISPVLVTVWVAVAGFIWIGVPNITTQAATSATTLTITRIAVVAGVVLLLAALAALWTSALRPRPELTGRRVRR